MLRFKPSVRIGVLDTPLVEPLAAAALWSLRTGIDVEVNSINDSHDAAGRGPASLHRVDLAVDLDTAGDRPADLARLYQHLRQVLPPAYDVVYEGDHVHVEWDAHRGPSPPPQPA